MAINQKYITTGRWTGIAEFLALNALTHLQMANLANTGRGAISTAIKAGHVVVGNSRNEIHIVPYRYRGAFE